MGKSTISMVIFHSYVWHNQRVLYIQMSSSHGIFQWINHWMLDWLIPCLDEAKGRFLAKTDLVGGFNPSEKYDFVSWDDDIPN